MKIFSLSLVVISVVYSILVFALSDKLREWGLDRETMAWSAFGFAILSLVISLSCCLSKKGKTPLVLSSIQFMGFLVLLMWSSSPSREVPQVGVLEASPPAEMVDPPSGAGQVPRETRGSH